MIRRLAFNCQGVVYLLECLYKNIESKLSKRDRKILKDEIDRVIGKIRKDKRFIC